jgi:hypothetical protein
MTRSTKSSRLLCPTHERVTVWMDDIPSAVSWTVSWLLPDSTAFHSLSVLSQLTDANAVLARTGLNATLTTGPSCPVRTCTHTTSTIHLSAINYVTTLTIMNRSRSYFTTDGQSVSQYVLVSSTLVGLVTRYYFLLECCCLKWFRKLPDPVLRVPDWRGLACIHFQVTKLQR